MKTVWTTKCVIRNPDSGNIFVVKRNPNDIRGGKHDLPGGERLGLGEWPHSEPYEDPVTAGLREALEEGCRLPDDIRVVDTARDIRSSKYGHLSVRDFIYLETQEVVGYFDTVECQEGAMRPKGFALASLGHPVQREAVAGVLPVQRGFSLDYLADRAITELLQQSAIVLNSANN